MQMRANRFPLTSLSDKNRRFEFVTGAGYALINSLDGNKSTEMCTVESMMTNE